MPENQESEEDIKNTVEKIFKDLTQRYVSELVKEATKSVVKDKGEKDAEKLEAALRGVSDEERKRLFQEPADEIRQKIYEGETKDDELIKEISKIIDKHLSIHKIVPDIEAIKGRPTGRGFWTRILPVAKIAIIIIIVAAAYEIIYPKIFVPELSVDTSELYFEMDEDGPIESKSFKISNAGRGTLRWWLSANENWIDLNPEYGSDSEDITVSIEDSLGPGSHEGVISIESNGGYESINVKVHVRQPTPVRPVPVPKLSVDESELKFEMDEDGSIESKSFTISNAGGGTLEWRLYANDWMELNPNRGSEFAKIKVSIKDSLGPGTYRGEISVESTGGHEYIDVVYVKHSPPVLPVPEDFTVKPEPEVTAPEAAEDPLAGCRNLQCHLVDEGNYDEAIACYNQAIDCYDEALKKKPENAEAWYLKGKSLLESGNLIGEGEVEADKRYQEAEECLDEAFRLNPSNLNALTDKAEALRHLGRYNEAMDLCNKAIENDSDFVEGWYCQGMTLLRQGKCEEAIDAYDEVLDRNPTKLMRTEVEGFKDECRKSLNSDAEAAEASD